MYGVRVRVLKQLKKGLYKNSRFRQNIAQTHQNSKASFKKSPIYISSKFSTNSTKRNSTRPLTCKQPSFISSKNPYSSLPPTSPSLTSSIRLNDRLQHISTNNQESRQFDALNLIDSGIVSNHLCPPTQNPLIYKLTDEVVKIMK
jgi:hypothetical protein